MYSILLSAGWPIWPLLIISIISLAISLERSWCLRKIHIFPKNCLKNLFSLKNQMVKEKSTISESQIMELANISHTSPLLVCALKEKLASTQTTWQKFERYLGALAIIATIAPLLGLFGTVVGMIEIFSSQGVINGAVDSAQQLAHGISIALYNTAFGLLIAIPVLATWNISASVKNSRVKYLKNFTKLTLQNELARNPFTGTKTIFVRPNFRACGAGDQSHPFY